MKLHFSRLGPGCRGAGGARRLRQAAVGGRGGQGLGRSSHWNAGPQKQPFSFSRGRLAAGSQGDTRALSLASLSRPGVLFLRFRTPWSLSCLQACRLLLGGPYIYSQATPSFISVEPQGCSYSPHPPTCTVPCKNPSMLQTSSGPLALFFGMDADFCCYFCIF